MRTINVIERVNQERNRRKRVAALSLSEASRLRLVSALLYEQRGAWLTSKIQLNINRHFTLRLPADFAE